MKIVVLGAGQVGSSVAHNLSNENNDDADLRRRAGVLILALRRVDGTFTTNPEPDTVIEPHQVLIAVGTDDDLRRLAEIV